MYEVVSRELVHDKKEPHVEDASNSRALHHTLCVSTQFYHKPKVERTGTLPTLLGAIPTKSHDEFR